MNREEERKKKHVNGFVVSNHSYLSAHMCIFVCLHQYRFVLVQHTNASNHDRVTSSFFCIAHSWQFPMMTKIAFDISSNVDFNERCQISFRTEFFSPNPFDLLNMVLMSVNILTKRDAAVISFFMTLLWCAVEWWIENDGNDLLRFWHCYFVCVVSQYWLNENWYRTGIKSSSLLFQ